MNRKDTQEALAKVAGVLEEALAEYETLEKMDLMLAEDPSRPAQPPKPVEYNGKDKEGGEVGDGGGKDDKDKKDDESDDTLKSEFAAITAKMEARGLLKKSEPESKADAPKVDAQKTEVEKVEAQKTSEIKKSEVETPKAEDKSEELRKAFDERFESLGKAIAAIAEKVEKIASQPAPRKGVAGYQPLKKSEAEEKSLKKTEVVEKLLELRKSGNKRVDSTLINRVETNRLSPADLEFIKGILG